jgi:hypothetical protein
MGEKYSEEIKLCLLKEDFQGAFRKKYSVKGSPTFLIFSGGIEKGRMLGKADPKTLMAFISEALPSIQSNGSM